MSTRPPRTLVRTFADGDHVPAARVGIGLALPGIALLSLGRPELLIFAVFGSFTGMYGRDEPPARRLRHQFQAAVVIGLGLCVGLALSAHSAPSWCVVVVAVVFAAAASVTVDWLGLVPQGPFFGIFALGAIAMLPAHTAHPRTGLLVYGATAVGCLAIGQIRRLRAQPTLTGASPEREPFDVPHVLVHAIRYVLALSAAGIAAILLHLGHVNWALAGAAVPLAAAGARNRVRRGMHRVAGTIVGLGVTAILLLPDLSTTTRGIFVILLIFPTEMFMTRHYGVALGFFTPLIMIMTELADPIEPTILLTERILGTLVGVAAGVAVAVFVRYDAHERPTLRR